MNIFLKVGIGVSVATNLFFIGVGSYGLLTQDARIKENRSYMMKVIQDEVYRQIMFVMPKQSGGVVK
jgi:hypothetical protein